MKNKLENIGTIMSSTLLLAGLTSSHPYVSNLILNNPSLSYERMIFLAGAISCIGIAMIGFGVMLKK